MLEVTLNGWVYYDPITGQLTTVSLPYTDLIRAQRPLHVRRNG